MIEPLQDRLKTNAIELVVKTDSTVRRVCESYSEKA
jgi:hypothetical protein